jgi:diaminohydroxyphosphoribosylaminopyrimidine deaminase/5-amino-6-(5-phosphoribosylamino)uracil reductase
MIRRAGIEVTAGVLEAEARKLNEAYIKHITTGQPFVTLKIAQTLDGRIATASGESKWITGKEARQEGHRLRDVNDAILVGINTVLKDNPALTTRLPGGRDPLRVIVDSSLRTPVTAKVLTQRSKAQTCIATTSAAPKTRFRRLLEAGAEIVIARGAKGRVDLPALMSMLTTFGVTSVLIEGGAEVNAAALKAGIVDKVVLFVAPTLMTGRDSLCSVGGESPIRLGHAVKLDDVTARVVGGDLMIEGYVRKGDPLRTGIRK